MGLVTIDDTTASDEARRLMRDCLVWDSHGCMPLRPGDDEFLPQLDRYHASGVDLCSLNIGFDVLPWENAILVAATYRRFIKANSDKFMLVETVEDIHTSRETGRLGVIFDLEGGCALNDQLSMVEVYHRLGVRWMLFAYNKNNSLGGGCDDVDEGLTEFGRQVLKEMEQVGMVVCCTHTGEQTALEIMELSENPVIFSHSNPRTLKDHYRNISDRAIRACAETGGVISVVGIGDFLGNNDNRTATVVEHIDYLVQLVGPTHVGLGLDFVFDDKELLEYLKENPLVFPPEKYSAGINMVCPEQTPEITTGLLERGYGEADVRKILGENHLRVVKHVWK